MKEYIMETETKPAFINHAGMIAQEFFRINENAMDAEIIRRWHQGMAQLREEFCGATAQMEKKEKRNRGTASMPWGNAQNH